MQLHTKILIGLALGVVVGAIANFGDLEWLKTLIEWVEPIGTGWIRLITMIVIPLVVSSLLVGTASLGDIRKLGRIGGKTVGYYLVTTAIAASLGLLLSNVFRPGSDIDPATRDQLAAQFSSEAGASLEMAASAPSVKEVLLNMIPRNPVQSAAEFDLLSLIFFTVLFGAAISVLTEDRKRGILSFFAGVNDASMVVIRWVMKIAPYAVFALIAAIISQFGLDLLKSLFMYALVVSLGLVLHTFGTVALIVRFVGGLNPLKFYRKIAPVQLVAFSTSSSNATLPVTMNTAESRFGISKEVSSFVLPLGATINMDGTAIYQAVAVMFIAQIYGLPLSLGAQLVVVLTATMASIGAAGVPSSGMITLIVVLQAAGLGAQMEAGIALIFGVDRILDMMRTITNVTGDLSCATFVSRTEGERPGQETSLPDGAPAAAS